MSSNKPSKKTTLNPHYVKTGKRIKEARLRSKESNSRTLSLRLGWSGGRINNFEMGVSTPGIEETLILAEVLGANPAWITYGVGPPWVSSSQETRHHNFIQAVDRADAEGDLAALLQAIQLTPERLAGYRSSPQKKIPDLVVRRCEKHLGMRKGDLDKKGASPQTQALTPEARELLATYERLGAADRKRLTAISQTLLTEAD